MIVHDSGNMAFRRPFGAAECSAMLTLAAEKPGASGMTLRLRSFSGATELRPMTGDGFGRFSVTFSAPAEPGVLWYSFLSDGEESAEHQLTVYRPTPVPEWWKDGIVYQIFPDRFARETDWTPKEPEKHKGLPRFLIRDWETPPFYPRDEEKKVSAWPFWGGTLRGIREKLPYLASLGVTVLYLNPIFEAASSHRYDTADYERIDPLLGTEEDFSALCRAAEARGIRVVLDGVFSHTGANSRYFDQCGQYGTGAQYRHWYRFGEQYKYGYECWWDVPDLPNVEESDPSYREFICGENGILRRWLRAGASGWRLDVADELPDSFIREIRTAMKTEKPDSLLLGEVWEDASCKVSYDRLREYLLGDELDATMHYPFRETVTDFLLGKISAAAAREALCRLQRHYPRENLYAALNLIGSHDRERILTLLGGDKAAVKLLSVLQFVLPGVPCIYYGDEAGMTGGNDPYNRGPYPWGQEDEDLREHYRSLARLYREQPLLRRGECDYLYAGDDVLGCRRYDAEGSITILVNRSYAEQEAWGLRIPARSWAMKGDFE